MTFTIIYQTKPNPKYRDIKEVHTDDPEIFERYLKSLHEDSTVDQDTINVNLGDDVPF